MTHQPRAIFITGIGRGLGRATAKLAAMRGFEVSGTVRHEADLDVVSQINAEVANAGGEGRVKGYLFDARNVDQMPMETLDALRAADILINNSGVGADVYSPEVTLSDMDENLLDDAIEVNAKAPWKLINLAAPEMKKRGWGRIVNISSARARLSQYTGDFMMPAYRLSKLMLNGITLLAGEQYRGSGVLVNSLCPGWCKTNMGGDMAPDTPERGAERIMRLALLPDDGPTGSYFIDDQVVSF